MSLWFVKGLSIFHWIVFGYFILLNTYYLVTSLFAFRALRRYTRRLSLINVDDLIASVGAPPVTLIVPAYNEQESCLEATHSFLSLRYPEHEVFIVNDGSTDATLEKLRKQYHLIPAPLYKTSNIPAESVRGIYQSRTHPNLWVIDKENGGRADAINAGLNFCRTPLFCAVDADSLIEPDALIRVVRPFLEDEKTVACGGIIRIANGCPVQSGLVQDVRLPRGLIARFQVVEYLRSFLAGRVGWDALGIMFLVSGAFGMFRRSVVVDAGGFASDSIGEDLELTIRLHRYCRENDRPYRITFVPDPVLWTEVPNSLHLLGKQRDRWQRGLIDSLWRHLDMLGNPKYGRIGLVAYPYFFFLEMIGSVLEFIGYFVFVVLLLLGQVSFAFAAAFLVLAFFCGAFISVVSIGLEELAFRRYSRFTDLLQLFGLSFLENFGFRQLITFYRFRGLISYFRGKNDWGEMEHQGFHEQTAV